MSNFIEQAKAPFPIGSRVQIEGRKGIWVVYDHHGCTWPLGEDVDRVVLIHANDPDQYVTTTWDQLRKPS
jgi:hypothetical protein